MGYKDADQRFGLAWQRDLTAYRTTFTTDFLPVYRSGIDSPFYGFASKGKLPSPDWPLPRVFEAEVAEVTGRITEGESVLISGFPNSGKTTVLRGVAENLHREGVQTVFLWGFTQKNMEDIKSPSFMLKFGLEEAVETHMNLIRRERGEEPVYFVYALAPGFGGGLSAQEDATMRAAYEATKAHADEIRSVGQEIKASKQFPLAWLGAQHADVRFVIIADELDDLLTPDWAELGKRDIVHQNLIYLTKLTRLPNVTMLCTAHEYNESKDDQRGIFPDFWDIKLEGVVDEVKMREIIEFGTSLLGKDITMTGDFLEHVAKRTGLRLYDINMYMDWLVSYLRDYGGIPDVLNMEVLQQFEQIYVYGIYDSIIYGLQSHTGSRFEGVAMGVAKTLSVDAATLLIRVAQKGERGLAIKGIAPESIEELIDAQLVAYSGGRAIFQPSLHAQAVLRHALPMVSDKLEPKVTSNKIQEIIAQSRLR